MYSGDAIACRIGLETEEVIDKFWVSVGVAAAVGVPEKKIVFGSVLGEKRNEEAAEEEEEGV
jgi:hypothetical protein